MHTIVGSVSVPHLLLQYREWVETEWGEVSPFDSSVDDFILPMPIFAIDQQILLGGIGFTDFAKPGSEDVGVWVNTLYVAPEFRNQGIGVELVLAAEMEARALKIDEMFVFTEMPEFYERLDWLLVNTLDNSTVLKRVLIS